MFKVLIHDIVNVNHDDSHDIAHVLAPHHLQAKPQFHEGKAVSPIMLYQLGWPTAIQMGHQLSEALHHLTKLTIGRLINRIHSRASNMVAIEGQMISVRLQGDRGFCVAELETGTVKIEIAGDAAIKL